MKVSFPKNYASEKLAGQPAEFETTATLIEAPQDAEIDDEFAKTLGLESLDKLKEAARERLSAEFAGATRQRVKRMLLDRLDEAHRFEAPPSLVEEEFNLMWNSIKAEMESSGKTFADEDTTEEAAKEEYRKIADRRVRLGLVLSEIGEKNKITVTDDEVSRAVIERARQMPGREKEVWDYYRNNANALAQLRAPIYEDKVVDFILELANVTEKKVTREDLYKDDTCQQGADEAVAIAKVIVQGGNAVAGLGVDGAQRDRVDAALGEQPLRRIHDGLAPGFLGARFGGRLLDFYRPRIETRTYHLISQCRRGETVCMYELVYGR